VRQWAAATTPLLIFSATTLQMLMSVPWAWMTVISMLSVPTLKMVLHVLVRVAILEMELIVQILMSVCWTLIHVIRSMQTALILLVAIHVPVMLASLEMEKHAHVLMATYCCIMEQSHLAVLKKAQCLFATTIHMAQYVMIDGMN
jgi:hypothetical protein